MNSNFQHTNQDKIIPTSLLSSDLLLCHYSTHSKSGFRAVKYMIESLEMPPLRIKKLKNSDDRIQAISHGKNEKFFLGPDFFITHFWGNILMIYGHWHLQNSFLKPLEP